jgi:hypothetical protein
MLDIAKDFLSFTFVMKVSFLFVNDFSSSWIYIRMISL